MKKIIAAILTAILLLMTCTSCAKKPLKVSSKVSSTESEKISDWGVDYYVDEFKRSTGKPFIYYVASGTFSNSATTDSELTAKILVSEDTIEIKLWEYGYQPVKGIYGITNYEVTILSPLNRKYNYNAKLYENLQSIELGFLWQKDYYPDPSEISSIVGLLKQQGTVSIYMKEKSKYSSSTYLFDIDTYGFAELYERFFGTKTSSIAN